MRENEKAFTIAVDEVIYSHMTCSIGNIATAISAGLSTGRREWYGARDDHEGSRALEFEPKSFYESRGKVTRNCRCWIYFSRKVQKHGWLKCEYCIRVS